MRHLVLLLAAACGASFDADSPDAPAGSSTDAAPPSGCFSSNDCPLGWTCSEFGTCEPPPVSGTDAGPATLPPEVERELSQPSSALRYVYVAMSEIDALAKIDGESLAVTSVPVGDRPEVVRAIPGSNDALVLDRGSATVTIVRPTVNRDDKTTLATLPHVNILSLDPTGRYAVAWFDLTEAVRQAGSLTEVLGEIGSFQEVTVIGLRGTPASADLAVGFRPREVEFDATGTRAFIVTDDGISVVDLAAAVAGEAHVAAAIAVTDDPLEDQGVLEVDVTADGNHAIVRAAGVPELRVVALLGEAAGAIHRIPLPAEATDVDLAPDGLRAYAVLRDVSKFAVIDVPGDALDPAGLELVNLGGELVGSAVLDDGAGQALLFTNAANVERVITIDLTAPGYPHVVRRLRKAVRTAAFAPDGATILVLHSKLPGRPEDATNVEEFFDRSYGYSILDVASGFAAVNRTEVDPGVFAFAPDSSRAYVTLDGGDAEGAVAVVQEMNLSTYVVADHELNSPPEAIGVLPEARRVFVSQRHPLGRVTFVPLDGGALRTITGFELNSHIVD